MEKPTTSTVPRSKRIDIFKYFPKTASFVIRNHPYSSTGREDRRRVFQSGPLISEKKRRMKKNEEFEMQEPMSPKVSCMGQIKHKKKCNGDRCNIKSPMVTREEKSKPKREIFGRQKVKKSGKEEEKDDKEEKQAAAYAPGLGQMRKFSSGRNSLAGFDLRDKDHKVYADDGDEEEKDEVIVPHSGPILMGGGRVTVEPKKEVNLWKRRSTSPPIFLIFS